MIAIETEILPYLDWLLQNTEDRMGALWWFLLVIGRLAGVALVLGYLVAAVRHGPIRGGDITFKVVTRGLSELFVFSPRRIWALSKVAIQESIRRRVLVVLGIYVVLLLLAGWFLDHESAQPVRLYLSFVLFASLFLTLALSLFLSAFSLPNDIKTRTIYTVVTKPVRPGEIVLGRMIGFTVIGTLILGVMCVCSYFFVVRALHHTHEIDQEDMVEVRADGEKQPLGYKGETSRSLYHRHNTTINHDGHGHAGSNLGHSHDAQIVELDGKKQVIVGPPRDLFRARVPIYGRLRFKDRTGRDKARGISVGNEWGYRSYIEGSTAAAAIWTFKGLREEDFPEGLPLEMYIRVFRSHKGIIDQGILGSLVLRNPETGKKSGIRTFRAKDFSIDEQFVPRQLKDSDGKEIDLFEDLVDKETGEVEIWIQCLNDAQYFGMAQADVYLQAGDARFEWNFLKGYLGIWLQMVLVICLGVMFSTFLNGPVAMIATLSSVILGFFTQFIIEVALGQIEGGGPLESMVRIVSQKNLTSELDQNLGTVLIRLFDEVAMYFMHAAAYLLPNFQTYGTADSVANGFNIDGNLVAQNLTTGFAYVLCTFIAGYFFFRIREVAK